MSRILSMNRRSRLSLKAWQRCGCREKARQIQPALFSRLPHGENCRLRQRWSRDQKPSTETLAQEVPSGKTPRLHGALLLRDRPNLTLTSVLRQPEFVGLWIRRSGMDSDLLTAEHCSGATRGERQCAPLPFVEYGLGTTVFAKRAGRQPGGSLGLVRLGKRDMTPTRIRGRLKVKSESADSHRR